ncbi:hydroxyacylglutathione hydrolase [Candidatus Liberibacter sp.]|uniref:hydroxyacylglutathione hydrolase n=1 Tax=Candidatus Liberibacter sp. TaxID=34022 RepID=UPI0015F5A7EB|nr:hydroxyacylglutathione hydrolase [Candidatus Liberibacter sp.]MBA5724010.1 hydroxyacylglutathione hydrolase [Candidatus Liberibacter sp.]
MKPLHIVTSLCCDDNFCTLIHDSESQLTATIDAPNTKIILNILEKKGWILTHIFNTHHHKDHIQANLELKKLFNCTIFGPLKEFHKIPGIDYALSDKEILNFGKHPVEIFSTPGHTIGHICYYFLKDRLFFVGDTLFSLGCGRIFEGTFKEMFDSLQKITSLPEETSIYFGHEYTYTNARFALSYDPNNLELQKYFSNIKSLLNEKRYTNPTTLSLEKKTNPFLRTDDFTIRKNLCMKDKSNLEVFTELRNRKDKFR